MSEEAETVPAGQEPPAEEITTGMQTVVDAISAATLASVAEGQFQDLVKAVVDVRRGIMVVGGDMHADEEALLLADGSEQWDLWGINLHPDRHGTSDFIEYDSVINIRPRQNNRSRAVEDGEARAAIVAIVNRLVTG